MPREICYTIEASYDGVQAGVYLRSRQGYSYRMLVRLRKRMGLLRRGGEAIRTIDPVYSGDRLTVLLEDEADVLPNFALQVALAYEDEDVAVFDKPFGMPVHPTRKHWNNTLANAFAACCEKRGEPLPFRPVYRIDQDTTGLVAIAKNAHAAAALSDGIEKEYVALVQGRVEPEEGVIDLPVRREGPDSVRRGVFPDGRRAVTAYRVLACNQDYSLVRLRLETGRTHQIRVHFSHLGHPLCGDALYGGETKLIGRQALHCAHACFRSPVTGKWAEVRAELHDDMHNAVYYAGLCIDGE